MATRLEKIGIRCLEDLLYHLPFRYLDRRSLFSIKELPAGNGGVFMGEVLALGEVRTGRKGRRIFEIIAGDATGYVSLKWFHYRKNYLEKLFKKGEKYIFFGDVTLFRGRKQMVHPEAQPISEFFDENEVKKHLGVVPVYSLTEGLTQRHLRKIMMQVLEEQARGMEETLSRDILEKYRLPGLLESFREIHSPSEGQSLVELNRGQTIYHRRLAFEEFYFLQLGLGIKRRQIHALPGFKHEPRVRLKNRLVQNLPFSLTQSQIDAVESIILRMCSPEPMNVLLQGDVGSGKTLVGAMASLVALENDQQVAMMVPTEILAEQHYQKFRNILHPLGVEVDLLTSSTKKEARDRILGQLKKGRPMLVLGTHALIEADVEFKNLSLVIIDEQHRFGVRQRLKLMRKGSRPDVLVMTATPIPRSLAMTLYGDLDMVLMNEMPKGRQPIKTRIMYEKNRPKLYDFIRKKLAEGRQVYFVFPLIEESEKMDLKDATQAYEKLQGEFSEYKVGMIHGRLKGSEKERIMNRFSQGDIQILVATTVIEVGIDVPNATVMVIEHAERFGLSQLHQLRGRVGRGSEKSFCILATGFPQSDVSKRRLAVMEGFSDGFKIAEEDLTIRGPGDFLGTRQSGIPELRVADLIRDLDLLEMAKEAAGETLNRDPQLSSPEHGVMKRVLQSRWKNRLGLAEVG